MVGRVRMMSNQRGPLAHPNEVGMRITNIETYIVDAGWRPWTFVKVETDEGITGYGECSDGRAPALKIDHFHPSVAHACGGHDNSG